MDDQIGTDHKQLHGCRKGFRSGGGDRAIARIRSSCTYVAMGYKLKQMHY